MGKKGGGRVRVVQKGPKMPANPMADFAIPPGECLMSCLFLSIEMSDPPLVLIM